MPQATFIKRKQQLLRKAMELSIMCDKKLALIIVAEEGPLQPITVYTGNSDLPQVLESFTNHSSRPYEAWTNSDVRARPHTVQGLRCCRRVLV